ncbi:hypothetical protein JOD14_002269 [Enterococcus lemanii]|nr:hypothetical protein [Enterococcus lemanii]
MPFQEVLAKKETILLSSSKKRLIRDLIVVHGLYMHFTGHGVILPVSKYFFQKG